MLILSLLCRIRKYPQKAVSAGYRNGFTSRIKLFRQIELKIWGQKRNKKEFNNNHFTIGYRNLPMLFNANLRAECLFINIIIKGMRYLEN